MFKRIRNALALGAIGVNVELSVHTADDGFHITFIGSTAKSVKRLRSQSFYLYQSHLKHYDLNGLMTYMQELDPRDIEKTPKTLTEHGDYTEGLVRLPSDNVYFDINNDFLCIERTETLEASKLRLLIVKKAAELLEGIKELQKAEEMKVKTTESTAKKKQQAMSRMGALLDKIEYLHTLKPKDEASKNFIAKEKEKLQKKINTLNAQIVTLQTKTV